MMRKYLWSVVWNLFLVFLLYQFARCIYWLENASYLHYSLEVFWGGLVFDTSAILYTNALWVLLMLFPWYRKEAPVYHRFCKGLYLVVNGITFAMNLADAAYFPYTMRRTTTSVFGEFSNEGNLGRIMGMEFLNHWYLVLLFVLVMTLLWWAYQTPRLDYRKITRKLRYHVVCLVSLLLFVPFCIAGMRGGFTTAVRPITISNANQYVDSPKDAALVLNTPFAMIRTIGKSVFTVPTYFSDDHELAAIYTPLHLPSSTLHLPPSTQKNIVILIVESFGREYIGALNKHLDEGHYQGYTPYVDRLISQSTTFRYSFCNGRKSIDGMPSILCSIPMFVEPFILTPASMNDFTGLAGILADEGYETAFFHGAQNGSMGFQAFARKTGFQKYYGRTEYEAAKGTDDFDGTWAIWDEPFLQFYAEEMSKMKEPFMTAVFTASSHHPFAIPEQYKTQFPEGVLEIHKCIRYTDMAIGKFLETAKKQKWFDNTIFVLTSDHTNMSNHAEYQTDLGGFASPIVIYDPQHPEGEMQDKIAQQIDIMPTLLGLLGYQKPYLAFGIDLFQTPAEDTWAVNYLNGIYQYVKDGHVLQFDGQQVKAVYALSDSLMQQNLQSQHKPQSSNISLQTKELKAIIQQYMSRMVHDRLSIGGQELEN